MNYESYWISGYVNNTFKRSHFRMLRSGFCAHQMPLILLFLPLQQCENSEGGPPCNSIALGVAWAYYTCSKVFALSSAASYMLNNAPLCLGGSRQSLKVREVKCVPGDPATTCPVLFKGSRSLLLLA